MGRSFSTALPGKAHLISLRSIIHLHLSRPRRTAMARTALASHRILTINSGSSSIKFSLHRMGDREEQVFAGKLDRIGTGKGYFTARGADGAELVREELELTDHEQAFRLFLQWLLKWLGKLELTAVGHRLVHGGIRHRRPQLITPRLERELEKLRRLAPDHLPNALKGIEAVRHHAPTLPQVACFDTSFHRTMPRLAQLIPIPREFWAEGVIRYGFHGLSYEYIMQELARTVGGAAAGGRIILAHLGNGASMAAVQHGRSLDTTMGFTPAGGLMMGTRSGDLGPGVISYFLEEKGLSGREIRKLFNDRSGLLGVSGLTSDMGELLAQREADTQAAEAIALFCYRAKQFLGALIAVLGGLDSLVFTGGIGENAPPIRWGICQGLKDLGIVLDPDLNDKNAPVISAGESRATVRVMKTNEELIIAHHTDALIRRKTGGKKGASDHDAIASE
jgi:acetate kinase